MSGTSTIDAAAPPWRQRSSWWLSRFLFLRVLGLIYTVAFLGLANDVLPLIGSTVFIVKAGILSGAFYFQAAAMCLTAIAAALFPVIGLTLFGIVSAVCFFIPGLKYYRQRGLKGRNGNRGDSWG